MEFKCPRCSGPATGDRVNTKVACKSKKCGWVESVNERAVEGPRGPVTVIEPRGGPGGNYQVDPDTDELIIPKEELEERAASAKAEREAAAQAKKDAEEEEKKKAKAGGSGK